MPPRSKKGKKAAKGDARSVELHIPEATSATRTDEDNNAMEMDHPEPSTSSSIAEATNHLVEASEKAISHAVEASEHAMAHAAESVKETVGNVVEAAKVFAEDMTGIEASGPSSSGNSGEITPAEGGAEGKSKAEGHKMTMEERKAKFEELRKKTAASSRANRVSMVEEAAKAKITAREAARLERQRKLAETLRLKADAEERGEDVERQKNWEYTIEENDEWEKKLARKRRRAEFEFNNDADAARRKYKKDLDFIKPNLEAYNKQKALALGQNAGALVAFNPSGESSELSVISQEQRLAAENLYRDANTLIYGDNKPSEEAIDKMVSKINKDIEKKGKFHRKRLNEEEGDITYINEHNRVFNKKIARYYDKYTAEIRASFERGTAL